MRINKPSATNIEAADRVNLLHGTTICRFEQWESRKAGQMLVSLPRYRHFMIVTKKALAFRHTNQTLDNFIKLKSILKQLCMWLVEVVSVNKQLSV